MSDLSIIGLDVFLEKRVSRMHVGVLFKRKGKLIFKYNDVYFKARNVIPLGPEFPLTQREFVSTKLFPSFEDRLPSKQNPAYIEYCNAVGIDPKESDPIILLSTIGRRGPSSFVFYPKYERDLSAKKILTFREMLNLTTREFGAIFEFSQNSVNALEKNRNSGVELRKRLELIMYYPQIAIDYLRKNGGYISHKKFVFALDELKKITQTDFQHGSSHALRGRRCI